MATHLRVSDAEGGRFTYQALSKRMNASYNLGLQKDLLDARHLIRNPQWYIYHSLGILSHFTLAPLDGALSTILSFHPGNATWIIIVFQNRELTNLGTHLILSVAHDRSREPFPILVSDMSLCVYSKFNKALQLCDYKKGYDVWKVATAVVYVH